MLELFIFLFFIAFLISIVRGDPYKTFIHFGLAICFCILIILFFVGIYDGADFTELNPNDYARITDVDYKAVVVDEPGNNGKVIITERLTFDIHAASEDNLFWELWRALPEDIVDGVKVSYKVNSVKQIYGDGSELVYDESSKLYWFDNDYINTAGGFGPGKWYHSKGPYSEDLRRYECVLFYVDGIYRDKVVFEIEYEMNNAALRYNDCSELYLSFYSEETIKYLKSFKGQVLFKNEDMPRKENYTANTYGTNSHTFAYTESDTINPGYHTFIFNLDESDLKFSPYNEYIEFALVSYGNDKYIFTDYAPTNKFYHDNVLSDIFREQKEYEALPKEYLVCKIIILIVSVSLSILIVRYSINVVKKNKKKYNLYKPTVPYDYFRDIPDDIDPYFISKFIFCKKQIPKNDDDGYASIMLSLIRKKYVEIVKINNNKDWTKNNIKIILNQMDSSSEKFELLTASEECYYKLLCRHSVNSEITLTNFQSKVVSDFEYTDALIEIINNSFNRTGSSRGYFSNTVYDQPKKDMTSISNTLILLGILAMIMLNLMIYGTRFDYAFGSFFIIGFAFIFSGIYLSIAAKKFILLTQLGEDMYAKWCGLYKFLNSDTLMKERTVIELPLWEKYLVYATAFGISKKVIKALKIRCPETNLSPVLSSSYYNSSFRITNHAFRRATRSAIYNSRMSSYGSYSGGYGGHGGYGGGGRGGGGGRRRSLISENKGMNSTM